MISSTVLRPLLYHSDLIPHPTARCFRSIGFMMFLKLAIFALIAVLRWLGSINNVDLINLININVNINSAVPPQPGAGVDDKLKPAFHERPISDFKVTANFKKSLTMHDADCRTCKTYQTFPLSSMLVYCDHCEALWALDYKKER